MDSTKADIVTRKKALSRDTAQVKSRQKELQTVELEIGKLDASTGTQVLSAEVLGMSEQLESDLQNAKSEAEEAELSWKKLESELESARQAITDTEENFAKAEAKLKSERAVLTAFDDELASLERDIEAKRQEMSDAELALQKLGHEIIALAKEETAATGLTRDLENQFEWIRDEKKSVDGSK